MNFSKIKAISAVLMGCAIQLATAQSWTSAYSSPTATGNCAGLPAALNSGFTITPVISRALFTSVAPYRVVKMAFFLQPGAQNSDIYMVEKGNGTTQARVLYYNGVDNTVTVIGTIPNVNFGGSGVEEQGLVGIALNPKTFTSDNFLYLFYCVGSASAGSSTVGWRISRFKLNPTSHMIDLASEKILMHIPAGNLARWHTAGAMQFDNFGNLYIGTGDNETLAMGSGNTADLRGALLRIRPDTTVPSGYTVPAGNFGEYWAQKWEDSGLVARAAKYRDTSKVKPEIYVKGSRNPYGISLDPNRLGWLAYSQCGPDAQRGETQNFVTKPAFGGWPFWVYTNNGGFIRQQSKAASYDEPNEPSTAQWSAFNYSGMSPNIPVNNWANNPGVDTLPPYNTVLYGYSSPTCGSGGIAYVRYDGTVSNTGKLPPHLDNTIFFTDFTVASGTNSMWAVKMNPATGTAAGSVTQVLTMSRSGRPNLYNGVDLQYGPDGALYYLDWGGGCCSASPSTANGGIVRISYTGTCQDPGLAPVAISRKIVHRGGVSWLRLRSDQIALSDDGSGLIESGSHTIQILDVHGRLLHTFKGQGARTYAMPELGGGRLFILRAETPIGTAVRTFSRL